jgi:hypothetical protein
MPEEYNFLGMDMDIQNKSKEFIYITYVLLFNVLNEVNHKEQNKIKAIEQIKS